MSHLDLQSFPTPQALARAAAQAALRHLRTLPGHPTLALSGGRIARDFFHAVASFARQPEHRGALDHTHFFWADERCVPPDHPDSNFALAHLCLLAPLRVPPDRLHRLQGEAPPPDAARAATQELAGLARLDAQGQPVLDLVLLGLGEDGHIASLFPGAPPLARDPRAVYLAVTGPKPPPRRLTLSFATLGAAREVWVLASGTGKEEALRASLATGGTTPLAQLLALRTRARTRVLTDLGPA